MRENLPRAAPPATAVPPASDSGAANTSAGFPGPYFASQDAPGAGDRQQAEAAANVISPVRLRPGLVGLFGLLAVVLIGIAATALLRDYRSTRALHAVARVATIPAPGQEQPSMQARDPAALPPAAPAGVSPLPGGSQASADPQTALVPIPSGPGTVPESRLEEAAASPVTNGIGVASGAVMASKAGTAITDRKRGDGPREVASSGKQGDEPTRPARVRAEVKAEKRDGAAKASKRNASPERRAVAKRTTRASGTFRRCPPLGAKGAVVCRWHICNGGAGKEPACRPYLERRP